VTAQRALPRAGGRVDVLGCQDVDRVGLLRNVETDLWFIAFANPELVAAATATEPVLWSSALSRR